MTTPEQGLQSGSPAVEDTEPSLPEVVDNSVLVKRILTAQDKWERIKADLAIQEGSQAALRTVANTAISLCELVPIVGNIPSWLADIAKVIARTHHKVVMDRERDLAQKEGREPRTIPLSKLDLTPDVSAAVAVASEGLEIIELAVAGVPIVPSHVIETSWQFVKDAPRLVNALTRLLQILLKQSEIVRADKQLVDAAAVFEVDLNGHQHD